jgi:hypothetical protein
MHDRIVFTPNRDPDVSLRDARISRTDCQWLVGPKVMVDAGGNERLWIVEIQGELTAV